MKDCMNRKVFFTVTIAVLFFSVMLLDVSNAGTNWAIETVDSAGTVGEHTSICVSGNYPRISYYSPSTQDLKYASWSLTGWSITTVDSAGTVGYYSSLALDSSGRPHISYYDGTNDDLKYAFRNTLGIWDIVTADSTGDVGRYSSLALDSSNNPHISYYDTMFTNDNLKYAGWSDAGSSWSIQIVDSAGNVGLYSSLALDSSDRYYISYYDVTNGDLKCARGRDYLPTGSIVINNGDTYTDSTSVNMSLTYSASYSTVWQVRYSNDGVWDTEVWEPPAASKTFWTLTSGDGAKTVYYQIKDTDNLLSDTYSDTIVLDTTGPGTPVPDDGVSGWSDDDTPTFSWGAVSDGAGSAVAGYYWKVDGGGETYTTGTSVTLSAQSDGSHTFYIRAMDNAGNYGSYGSHYFQIDTIAPTGTITINGGASSTTTVSVTLSLTYSDAGSGVTQVRYSNDGVWDDENWEDPSSSKLWSLTAGAGEKTVYYQVKDEAGNLQVFSDTIMSEAPETLYFEVSFEQEVYVVETYSNSSVSAVSFNVTMKRLRVTVDGESGTEGFCTVTVPADLMSGDFSLYMDDVALVEDVDYTQSNNGTHYMFGVNYMHSSHILELVSTEVIPEFTTWLLLPFLMLATLLGFALRKRLKKDLNPALP